MSAQAMVGIRLCMWGNIHNNICDRCLFLALTVTNQILMTMEDNLSKNTQCSTTLPVVSILDT